MKKIFAFLLTITSLTAFTQTASVQSYSLKEAVDYAVANNVKVKNSKLDITSAKWRNLEIVTQGLPQVSGEVGYSYYFKKPEMPGIAKIFSDTSQASGKIFGYQAFRDSIVLGDNTLMNILRKSEKDSKDKKVTFALSHNFSTSLQVSQLLFDGRYIFGIKATKDLMKTARMAANLSEQEIKYEVMKAYYQAQAAQESKTLLSENLKLIDKLVSDTRATYNEGLIEELDVNRLELAQATLQSQINLLDQRSKVALDNLKYQMGLPLSDIIILKDKLSDLKEAVQIDLAMQFDAKQRIEYELLEKAITLQGYDVKQKRVGYYPSLFAFLTYGWQAQSDNFADIFRKQTTTYSDGDTRSRTPWFDQGLAGITLKVPIFDSGLKMAQVKQAKIEQMKRRNEFENFISASELQFKAAQSSFNAAVSDEAISKRTGALSGKIFNTNSIKFKEGIGNSFELVQSEQENITNQLKYIQSVLTLLNTKADLDKALGVK